MVSLRTVLLMGLALATVETTAAAATPLDLQKLIDETAGQKEAIVKIPAGTFTITTPGIAIVRRTNLTVQGAGATTTLVNPTRAAFFSINGSCKITLRGFNLDYAIPPFIQATIVEKSADGGFVCEAHKGYPDFTDDRAQAALKLGAVYLFDKQTRGWKSYVACNYHKCTVVGPTRVKVSAALIKGGGYEDLTSVRPGDFAVFSLKSGGGNAIFSVLTKDLRVEDVCIFSAPLAAYLGRYMYGDNYFRYTVARGPRPEGATEERLMSSNADTFNYAFATKGPVLERCDFGFAGDDGVNLHGCVYPVVKIESQSVFWIATWWADSFWADPAKIDGKAWGRVVEKGTYRPRGMALVKAAGEEKKADAEHLTTKVLASDWRFSPAGKTRTWYYKIVLERPIAEPIRIGDGFDCPATSASGFSIRNCYFHDARGNGTRIMASRGVIENCRFERLKFSAIALGCEYYHWHESGWVSDVLVRGNRIKDCHDSPIHPREDKPGEICVFAALGSPIRYPYYPGNSQIRIMNNVVEGTPVSGIYVNAASGVVVANNTVRRYGMHGDRSWFQAVGLDAGWGITVANSKDVTVKDNTFEQPGPFAKGEFMDLGADYTETHFLKKKDLKP